MHVCEAPASLCRVVMVEMLESTDVLEAESEVYGLPYFRGERQKKAVMTVFGKVEHERTPYRRRNAETIVPTEEADRFLDGLFTPLAERLILQTLSRFPSQDG